MHLCKYCGRPIPPAVVERAQQSGLPPTFCSRSCNTLFKQRKRRLIAKGLAGDELAAALAKPPNLRPPEARQTPARKRAIPPKPPKAAETAPDPGPRSAVRKVEPSQGTPQLAIDALPRPPAPNPVRDELLAKLSGLTLPRR